MTRSFFIFSLLLISGCGTTKTVSFNTVDNKGNELKYTVVIPKGYSKEVFIFENEKLYTYTYSDSARLFFSDNLKQSSFYPDAYKKYGENINLRFLSNDTITISGNDTLGNYWKTVKRHFIVCGYTQVPSSRLQEFEKMLNTLNQKD